MQTAGFISDYIFLDFSRQWIPTSQLGFDGGVSFSRFDFGANFSYTIYIYIYMGVCVCGQRYIWLTKTPMYKLIKFISFKLGEKFVEK